MGILRILVQWTLFQEYLYFLLLYTAVGILSYVGDHLWLNIIRGTFIPVYSSNMADTLFFSLKLFEDSSFLWLSASQPPPHHHHYTVFICPRICSVSLKRQ